MQCISHTGNLTLSSIVTCRVNAHGRLQDSDLGGRRSLGAGDFCTKCVYAGVWAIVGGGLTGTLWYKFRKDYDLIGSQLV